KDVIQFGKVALLVEATENGNAAGLEPQVIDQIVVEATANSSWEDAIEDLLDSILNDAVQVLDAQRGAIVLAEGPDDKLTLRGLASGLGDPPTGRFAFSQKLARRCFDRSESILCCSVNDDPELAAAQSI